MTPALLQLFAQEAGPAPEEVAMGGFMVFWILCMGFSMIVGILSMALWVWMLVDCIQNEPNSPDNQFVLWLIVILLAGGLGAIIYYFVRRKPRLANAARFPSPQYPAGG